MSIEGTVIETATEDEEEDSGAPPAQRRRAAWRPTLVVVALVLAPVVAVCISLIGRHYHPGGDQALELLRIEDVGTKHTPLLGAWSRWGWAHPGPALFWLLTPFYWLFGETGVPVGMGVLNGLAIAGVIVLAYRRGGNELAALAGLMMALLVRALGLSLMVDIWNPWAAFLPFVLFLMLVWSSLCRDWLMLPIAVFVGSCIVQTHAGYLPLVGPLLLIAVGFGIFDAFRRRGTTDQRSRARRRLLVTGVVALVVWTPTLVQQIFSNDGNLASLFDYIRNPTEATAGWTIAYGTFGTELRPFGAWLTGNDDDGIGFTAFSAVLPAAVYLAVIACTGMLAWWRGRRDAARLSMVAVIAVVVAVIATSKLTGGVFIYVTRWWWAVAAIATLAVVWAVLSLFESRLLRRTVTGAAIAGIVVVGLMSATDLPATFAHSDMLNAVDRLNRPTANALDHRSRYLIEPIDTSQLGFVSNGLFVALQKQGYQVFMPPDRVAELQFGKWRLTTPDRVDATISVVDTAQGPWQPPPGSRLVASYDPLSPAERARSTQLEVKMLDAVGAHLPTRMLVFAGWGRILAKGAGVSPPEIDELAALQRRGDGFEVYVTPVH